MTLKIILVIMLCVPVFCLAVWIVARLGSSAYFRSKREFYKHFKHSLKEKEQSEE